MVIDFYIIGVTEWRKDINATSDTYSFTKLSTSQILLTSKYYSNQNPGFLESQWSPDLGKN